MAVEQNQDLAHILTLLRCPPLGLLHGVPQPARARVPWRDHADDVRGDGIDSGHFIPEEGPDSVYGALMELSSA